LLAPMMFGSVADRWWFGATSAWMNFCCFNNSFLPLDSGSQ
jgi:hypothetical protein